MHFKKNLNYLIKKHKLELIFLAEKAGITADKLYDILGENTSVEVEVLVNLANYFELSIDDIILKDLSKTLDLKALNIKFLVLDVDGVLTDAGMYYTESGDEMKKFNAKDGIGIIALTKSGFPVGIISHGTNTNILERRAKKLGIERVYAGKEEKIKILKKWFKEMKLKPENVAYIGDDINDMDMYKEVGLSACPADAHNKVKKAAKIILTKKGGEGCVREFIDEYLS